MIRGQINQPYRPAHVESVLWACVGFLGGMLACAVFVYSLLSVQP